MMLAVAWASLPDLPTYRTGVILVGLARCIAMVRFSSPYGIAVLRADLGYDMERTRSRRHELLRYSRHH